MPGQSWRAAVKRSSTRGHVVHSGLGLRGRPWKPASNAKADEEGDSGIERFIGCSCRVVGCRSRNDASSSSGRSEPRGERRLDEVA